MRVFAALGAAIAITGAAQAGTSVYHGGHIVTMEGEKPVIVEAVAVSDGKIVALGSEDQVRSAAGSEAKDIDLAGRTMLPGFIDAHGHVAYVGANMGMAQIQPPPVSDVDSIAKLQEKLRNFKRPPGMPILLGMGYDDAYLKEKRHPTRHDLDAVSAQTPILIIHASSHLAVMNSAMLKLVGVTADTPDPEGGIIRREEDGKTPNGVLEETAFFENFGKISQTTPEQGLATLIAGARLYAKHGHTTAQDGLVSAQSWPGFVLAQKDDRLKLDITVLLDGMHDWPAATASRIGGAYQGNVRVAGLKYLIDGSPQGRTAWLKDPVHVPPEGKGPHYHGYPAVDLKKLGQKFAKAAKNDWQIFVHVNGDEAAQALIDRVRQNGLSGKRTIAIHNQVVRREQLKEMKKLDIQPSFFANHTFYWGDWHRDVALGPKRADFISPQNTAWNLGLRPSAHNDSPVVPPNIMKLVWSSVNRRTQSGDILGPLERIDAYRALQQVTINAAWQIREDDRKGSIAKGKLADFVLLDRNPLTVKPMEIDKIKVVATIKEGEVIYGSIDRAEEAK